MLYLIGLGIGDEKDISLRGIEACKKAEKVYLELYTCPLKIDISYLEKIIEKKITILDRKGVEESENIIKSAIEKDTVLLVGGDPLSATTHAEIILEARKRGVKVDIVHSSSIFTAVAETGLSLYKFGKTVSLPKPQDNYFPTSPYENISDNLSNGMHSLVLLDIGMSAEEGMSLLLELEKKVKGRIISSKTKIAVCAHLGKGSLIRYGMIKDLQKADFGEHPHCLIIPAKLNFAEEEFLENLG
ncbi:MAG: diphthine synthase [Candidatus Aenigmarchaeota archaeon]|nr:diphthine synthase [Candidatus Aenigmarchaeota archaeon]